jgi:hypothetical protein
MYRHPTIRCRCGAPLNGAVNADSESGDISPGDYTVCGYCGAVYQLELGPHGLAFALVPDSEVPADVAALSLGASAGRMPRGVQMPPGRRKWS